MRHKILNREKATRNCLIQFSCLIVLPYLTVIAVAKHDFQFKFDFNINSSIKVDDLGTENHNTLFCPPKHCFQFLLGIAIIPREIENDAYAKFGEQKIVLW